MSSVFSFRAECRNDVEVFLPALATSGVSVAEVRILDSNDGVTIFPDVFVEITTSEANVDDLIQVTRQMHDLHVIAQTLRPVPLADNSLERDPRIAA